MLKSLKRFANTILENTPVVADYNAYYRLFPRTVNSYRGVFSSFAEALQQVPQTIPAGYNHNVLHDSSGELPTDPDQVWKFNPIDYPVLVWLRHAFADSSRLFDLGGSTGYGYYSYRKYIAYPASLRWLVCEVPTAVDAGNKLLETVPSPGLAYTTNFADANGSEIFLTCGALQYIEPPLSDLLHQLQTLPRHIIVHHVPFYQGKEYITLQNLWNAYAPYKIQNYTQFVAAIEALDYELIDAWKINRTCSIPFHPERFVDAYHGLYFRQRSLKT